MTAAPYRLYRHGLTVRARHLPEGRALVTWMLLPSVRPEPAVPVEPVGADGWIDTLAGWLLLLLVGLVIGWAT